MIWGIYGFGLPLQFNKAGEEGGGIFCVWRSVSTWCTMDIVLWNWELNWGWATRPEPSGRIYGSLLLPLNLLFQIQKFADRSFRLYNNPSSIVERWRAFYNCDLQLMFFAYGVDNLCYVKLFHMTIYFISCIMQNKQIFFFKSGRLISISLY